MVVYVGDDELVVLEQQAFEAVDGVLQRAVRERLSAGVAQSEDEQAVDGRDVYPHARGQAAHLLGPVAEDGVDEGVRALEIRVAVPDIEEEPDHLRGLLELAPLLSAGLVERQEMQPLAAPALDREVPDPDAPVVEFNGRARALPGLQLVHKAEYERIVPLVRKRPGRRGLAAQGPVGQDQRAVQAVAQEPQDVVHRAELRREARDEVHHLGDVIALALPVGYDQLHHLGDALVIAEVHAAARHEYQREVQLVRGLYELRGDLLDKDAGVVEYEPGLAHGVEVPYEAALHLDVVLDADERRNHQLVAYEQLAGEQVNFGVFEDGYRADGAVAPLRPGDELRPAKRRQLETVGNCYGHIGTSCSQISLPGRKPPVRAPRGI